MTQLDQLKQFTTVVADTGDFEAMKAYKPQDATTNPSLILQASQKAEYKTLVDQAIAEYKNSSLSGAAKVEAIMDRILILFGLEILKIVPGRVSTEVDARLSFDTKATVDQAVNILQLYQEAGVGPDRVLIKIAATWEGIEAARQLERMGIHCNLTLLFSMSQALACADAGVTLISPFVGRITDWAKAHGQSWDSADQDPGVQSVRRIFQAYKARGVQTQIMGASFRNTAQVLALAGCDLLTVSPDLLGELSTQTAPADFRPSLVSHVAADRQAPADGSLAWPADRSEAAFRFELNQDALATEKLAEGIRLFHADGQKLRALLA